MTGGDFSLPFSNFIGKTVLLYKVKVEMETGAKK